MSDLGVADSCELPCGCWDLNPDHLEQQPFGTTAYQLSHLFSPWTLDLYSWDRVPAESTLCPELDTLDHEGSIALETPMPLLKDWAGLEFKSEHMVHAGTDPR